MKCRYHIPGEYDPFTGETYPGTEADCDQLATHISCKPFTGTPTCAEHSCRCAELIIYERLPRAEAAKEKSGG